jgi:hypothetical protein
MKEGKSFEPGRLLGRGGEYVMYMSFQNKLRAAHFQPINTHDPNILCTADTLLFIDLTYTKGREIVSMFQCITSFTL